MPRPNVAIPIPLSSFPGTDPQEGGGRLINCHAQPLEEASRPTGPARQKWVGDAGLLQHALTPQSGYRGGLLVKNLSYETFLNNASTVDITGNVISLGVFPGTKFVSIARDQASNPDVVAVDPDNGAYILNTAAVANASITATIAGAAFNSGDTVNIQFVNTGVPGFPVTVIYTLGAAETATTVAAGLKALINGNATLTAADIAAASALGVLTITQQGAIGNGTTLTSLITGTGSETVTYNPASGAMAGGAGVPGIVFTGVPLAYNGLGNLPQPNSVCNQDGYFFFTIGDGRCFATGINNLSLNALTYITCQAKADVTLLRAIPFSSVLLLFTTGGCEIWQDAANAAPAFPYARLTVIEFGLAQGGAIAGYETGFSELLWVAQDNGIYWMTPGSLAPVKVSPPDLDRLIEASIKAGDLLNAGIYVSGGKKFWHLSSSRWTWQINLSTKKWNERWSLATGQYGRWRGSGGHPAFNRWLMGDQQSGNILYPDDTAFSENGQPMLFRIETGPAREFPQASRIARADFDFVFGTGQVEGAYVMTVLNAISGTNGVVRLNVSQAVLATTGDVVQVAGITGTVEANGTFPITVIDAQNIELQGTVFKNAYIGGGAATDITVPPNAVNPTVAISCSVNGGYKYDNPSIRSLMPQRKSLRARASIKNRGQSTTLGTRWRIDITDPVYRSFLGATMSTDPREIVG
jgi:hypothetical protein